MTKTILDFFKKTPSEKVAHPSQSPSSSTASPSFVKQKNIKEKDKRSSTESSGKENACLDNSPDCRAQKRAGSLRSEKNPRNKKRRRLVVESDSEGSGDSEYKPSEEDDESEEDPKSVSSEEEVEDLKSLKSTKPKSTISSRTPSTPSANSDRKKKSLPISRPVTPRLSDVTKTKLSLFAAANELNEQGQVQEDLTNRIASEEISGKEKEIFDHLTFKFLHPDNIRDVQRHSPDQPEYDPRTLYVPESFKNDQTPAMRQWWELKSRHFDTILFFKVGKFYELYHMDAVDGVKELGLVYMRGSYAHSGFPEIAYARMANQLIEKGYKVARVEQTETNDAMVDRTRGRPVKERVVRREVCQVTTPGTRTANSTESGVLPVGRNAFLLAVKEISVDRSCNTASVDSSVMFGVAFVDTSVGIIRIGQFSDDRQRSRLRTLFAHYPPSQILYEKGCLKPETLHILNTCLASVLKEGLVSKKEFWDSSKTLAYLAEAPYFHNETTKTTEWPDAIKETLSQDDNLGRTARDNWSLGVSALGALVFYLGHCLLDDVVLSMRLFEIYQPRDLEVDFHTTKPKAFYDRQAHMVLDGITLANLDILTNSSTGTTECTLVDRLDYCSTQFGKRLLRQWITSPLCYPSAIEERLGAVESLMKARGSLKPVRDKLKKLPDLEKLIAKIHLLGCRRPDANHPDNRAVLYEELTYSRRKIEDFVLTLNGLSEAAKLPSLCRDCVSGSTYMDKLLFLESEDGRFPDLEKLLTYFQKAFDHEKAKKDGRIIPQEGVDEDFDQAFADIEKTQDELDCYLREQCRELGCKITYFGNGRNRYQLEIPESGINRVPKTYELASQRKGFKRYKTRITERLLNQMMAAEEKKDAALRDVMRRLFAAFAQQ